MMHQAILIVIALICGLGYAAEHDVVLLLSPSLNLSSMAQANLDKQIDFYRDVIVSKNLSIDTGLSGILWDINELKAAGILDDKHAQEYAVGMSASMQKDPSIKLNGLLAELGFVLQLPEGHDLFVPQKNAYDAAELLENNKKLPLAAGLKAAVRGAFIAKYYSIDQKMIEANDFVPQENISFNDRPCQMVGCMIQ